MAEMTVTDDKKKGNIRKTNEGSQIVRATIDKLSETFQVNRVEF